MGWPSKCCCCIPIRTGFLIIGYCKLILYIVIYITRLVFCVWHNDQYVLEIPVVVIDIDFTIILIVAAQKNNISLLKAYLVYSLIWLVIYVVGVVVILYYGYREYVDPFWKLLNDLPGIALAIVLIFFPEVYFILLIVSHMKKLQREGAPVALPMAHVDGLMAYQLGSDVLVVQTELGAPSGNI